MQLSAKEVATAYYVCDRMRLRCFFSRPDPILGVTPILAFFFANLLAALTGSVDLTNLRCSFERPDNLSPKEGSAFGMVMTVVRGGGC